LHGKSLERGWRVVVQSTSEERPDERRRFSVVRGDGSANQHGPAFYLDQTWQIRTFPMACFQAISEIREPQRQHPQDKDKAQMGFCPAPAPKNRSL
jgi:hypothetical protein